LFTVNEPDGPFKWCRVDEKPAVKQFTALIFCFLYKKESQGYTSSMTFPIKVFELAGRPSYGKSLFPIDFLVAQ